MEKGNYYFNDTVGYIFLEDFDDKFVTILCVSNKKTYSFLDKNILKDFEEKLFVSKYMVDFYCKEHQFDNDVLDCYFNKFSRIIDENVTTNDVNDKLDEQNEDKSSFNNVIEPEVINEKVIEENVDNNDPLSKESIKKFVKDAVKDVADGIKETGKFIKDIFDKL